jgi:hypothetical protein
MGRAEKPFIPSSERFWLVSCTIIVILSMVLGTTTEVVSFLGFDVPTLCPLRWITDRDCLGCGMTRSFVFMGHGELTSAFGVNKLGPAIYSLVVAQLPWRIYRLWRHRHLKVDANQVL